MIKLEINPEVDPKKLEMPNGCIDEQYLYIKDLISKYGLGIESLSEQIQGIAKEPQHRKKVITKIAENLWEVSILAEDKSAKKYKLK